MRIQLIPAALLLSAAGSAALGQAPLEATLRVDIERPLRQVPRAVFGHNIEWAHNGQGLFRPDGTGPRRELVRMLRPLRPRAR